MLGNKLAFAVSLYSLTLTDKPQVKAIQAILIKEAAYAGGTGMALLFSGMDPNFLSAAVLDLL